MSELSLNLPADVRINAAVCNYFDSVATIITPPGCVDQQQQPAGVTMCPWVSSALVSGQV